MLLISIKTFIRSPHQKGRNSAQFEPSNLTGGHNAVKYWNQKDKSFS